MKIKGVRTTRENVEVEVSRQEIMSLIKNAIEKRHPDLDYDYIENGEVYVYDYTNGHNGNDEYRVLRPANDKDRMFDRVLKEIDLSLRNLEKN